MDLRDQRSKVLSDLHKLPHNSLIFFEMRYKLKFEEMSEDEFSRFVAEFPSLEKIAIACDCISRRRLGSVSELEVGQFLVHVKPSVRKGFLQGDCPYCSKTYFVDWGWDG